MQSLVSICIPTCHRPELLKQAIQSCLDQTYKPIEIIIGDDSQDDRSQNVVKDFNLPEIVRYYRNLPPLGQADNVNQLFDLALGERLSLLHDDDLLLPEAIQAMAQQWEKYPELVSCFGKQYVIDMEGNILKDISDQLNQKHYRNSDSLRLAYPSIWSALVGQFPNNGYLILTDIARKIRYRSHKEVGNICDYDFGIRVALKHENIHFIDEYMSMARRTDSSISKTNNNSDVSYQIIESLNLPANLEVFRDERLKLHAVPAVSSWLSIGNTKLARKVYRSRYYSWQNRLAPKGLIHAFLLLLPNNFARFLFRVLRHS